MHRRNLLRAGVGLAAAGALGVGLRPAAEATAGDHRRYGSPTRWGMSMPGIVSSFRPTGREVALTFDACSGACDMAVLDVLARHRVPATLFLNGHWIDANRQMTRRLAADPLFDIGNHGTRHVPLSVTGRSAYGIAGTRSPGEARDEVVRNHEKIARITGRPPRWFRTGTAHYDDVGVQIVHDAGETPVGFTVNGDAGATARPATIEVALAAARPGSIVLDHMNHPGSGIDAALTEALPRMLAQGWRFVTLDEALGTSPLPMALPRW